MRLWASIDTRDKCSHKIVSRKQFYQQEDPGGCFKSSEETNPPHARAFQVPGQAVLTPGALSTPGHHQGSALLLIAQRKSEMINGE